MESQTGTFNPAEFNWQGLTMTPDAARHIRDLMAQKPGLLGVRLSVKQSGCAGFGYVSASRKTKTSCSRPMARGFMFRLRRCRLSTAPKWITCAKA